jgi:hypothetical protein
MAIITSGMNQAFEHDKRVRTEDCKYEPKSNPLQRFCTIFTGIAVVVLGGYYLYNRSNSANAVAENHDLKDAPAKEPVLDTIAATTIDSSLIVKQANTHKFILEITNSKIRALKRYNQLKSMAIDVRMDTPDSTNFKLYFVILHCSRYRPHQGFTDELLWEKNYC